MAAAFKTLAIVSLVCGALCVTGCSTQAQEPITLGAALSRLRQSVEKVPQAASSQRLVAALDWLDRNSAKADPAQISVEYTRAIQRAAELLSKDSSAGVIDDITEDLEAKVDHCRKLGVPMGGRVLVRVNTQRQSGPARDWQVLYILKFYERLSGVDAGNFPRLSTPTDMQLEPGRYWVWAKNPTTGRMSERALVRVSGEKEIVVDIPVP
jgi:hypothetical protein